MKKSCEACGRCFTLKSGSKAKHCSQECRYASRWRHGTKSIINGYVVVKEHDHPGADDNGYVYEHRLIVERNIGRYLRPGECVHHINHTKTDNRISNLVLVPSNAEHQRIHALEHAANGEPLPFNRPASVAKRTATRWGSRNGRGNRVLRRSM